MTTHYFSPGPASLPQAVRNRIKEELLDTFGIGVSILEISHRSKQYDLLNQETLELLRKVFAVPSSHSILLTPFGAQQHFSLIINHLSTPGETIGYTDTDIWAHLATIEAQKTDRTVSLIFDGRPLDYKTLQDPSAWKVTGHEKYIHLTVNNTAYGTEYKKIPTYKSVPLVLDMTSALGARSDIPWEHTGLIYASAQKNFGIAGASVVIIRNDLLEQIRHNTAANHLGSALSYPSIFDANSILNTPPVFPIYCINRMLQWMENCGGLAKMEALAFAKTNLIYEQIDKHEIYQGRPQKDQRSRHNCVFNLTTPDLETRFIEDAAKEGLLEIKGFKSIGGIRVSIYNGVSLESAQALAHFMDHFAKKH